MLIIRLGYKWPFFFAAADSLVFNSLFALFGIGLWYLASYSNLKKVAVVEIIIQHFTAATITVLVWLSAGYFILRQVIRVDIGYDEFLDTTRTIRIISGVLYYVIMMAIFYLIINLRELEERIKHESRLNEMLKEAELKSLRSQIRPHFLFNSLNSISALTMSDASKAQEMVIKLSEFMRYSLTQFDEQLIELKDELYHVRLYLDIEKVRFGNKLVIEYAVDEKCFGYKVPALILQPLVENSIKYGVYESTQESKIEISSSCQEEQLNLRIKNYFDPDYIHQKGTGTGLQNIRKRLHTIYGRSDLISVEKTEDLFIVELKIPHYEEDQSTDS
ncbi:MAG: histidine kinase [Bacteroidetes bacterium]|nr:histidine kinase [Bacteroidota bacterium]